MVVKSTGGLFELGCGVLVLGVAVTEIERLSFVGGLLRIACSKDTFRLEVSGSACESAVVSRIVFASAYWRESTNFILEPGAQFKTTMIMFPLRMKALFAPRILSLHAWVNEGRF